MSSSPLPAYAFPVRALRRWASEHLQLRKDSVDGVEASFRLEGSSCGNVPIVLRYVVRLGPAEAGWPIRHLSVAPEPHDDGYQQQCAFRADAADWWDSLRREQPGLGESLEQALAWAPPTSPAGCLCTESSRAHKWRIVLHTLHYALTTPSLAP